MGTRIDTNRSSVPVRCVGQALTARIHRERIALYQGTELTASHARCHGRHMRIVIPEHDEPVFALKPRARTMRSRDWLVGLGGPVAPYVQRLCQRRYQAMEPQIADLYTLAAEVGTENLARLVQRALDQEAVGVEYLRALLVARPAFAGTPSPILSTRLGPPQWEVERDLAVYEAYVANGARAEAAPAGAER